MNTDLPYWLRVLSALGPTLAASATLLVGLMVATVAYRQWRTAHQKLVLDLFEKRLAVYVEIEDAAAAFEGSNGQDTAAFPKAREAFRKAKFLFGPDAFAEIHTFYKSLLEYQSIPPEVAMYDPEKSASLLKANAAALEAVKTFRLRMPDIFEPYLRMAQKLNDTR
ncbi:hypothetical protein [Rhizobium leguminosarum]|uniref:hypothetical protein n=1 Tax=Rhizobium leguminosarum TaxID=384 RepID=UPI003ECCD871